MVEDYPWWKFVQRPEVSRKDYYAINGKVKTAEAMALWRWVQSGTVQYQSDQLEKISIFGITQDYNQVRDMDLQVVDILVNLSLIVYKMAHCSDMI